MNEYGQAQLDAFKAGSTDPENYYTNWGSFNSFPNNWPILRDNLTHPDGYPLDFVTLTREYGVRTMTDNIARDVCAQYGAELPQDTFYQAGGTDFRNDCGEAISASISSLSSDQLHILSEAEAILEAENAGQETIQVVSNAAYMAPSGSLSGSFQAGALLELLSGE